MLHYIVWAVVLMGQAGSSTWASRARNSRSVSYHGVAAIFSHGVWFVSNLFLIDNVVAMARQGAWRDAVFLGVFYTTFCTIGSMLAHAVSAKLLERGARKVGG